LGNRGRPRKQRLREIEHLLSLGLSREEIMRLTGLTRKGINYYCRLLKKRKSWIEKSEEPFLGFSSNLPFDVTYAPTCNVAFGKSLGDTLPPKGLYKVLAKAPKGSEDLGLRARLIRIILSYEDHPLVKRALEYASKQLKRIGLEPNYAFANDVGALVRKLVSYLANAKVEFNNSHLVNAIIYYSLCKHGIQYSPRKTEKLLNVEFCNAKLRFKPKDLELVEWFVESPVINLPVKDEEQNEHGENDGQGLKGEHA